MTRMTKLALVAALVATVAPSTRAEAGDDPDVAAFNGHVDRALAAREAGDHGAAVEAFDEALAAIRDRSGPTFDKGRGVVRYQQVRSYIALERWVEARALLRLLVASPGIAASERATIEARLAEVEAAVDAQERARRPAHLTITARAADETDVGVDVVIDGVAIGRAPLTVARAPGRYVVEAAAEGYRAARREIPLGAGEEQRASFVLEPLARPWEAREAVGWGLVAGGVVSGAVAAGLAVAAEADFEAAAVDGVRYERARALRDSGEGKRTGAWALVGVGVALAGAGLVALLWSDGGDAEVSVAPGPGGVIVTGGF